MTMSAQTEPIQMEKLRFLSSDQVQSLAAQYGTPLFVYSEAILGEKAKEALCFTAPYGLTVRFAMKANPLAAVLKVFDNLGIQIDASSGYEAHRAILAGVKPNHIMLTSQELPDDLESLVAMGVKFNATSLHQLEVYGQKHLRQALAVRLNAGLGSGYRPGVSVAGPGASFGIWHEHVGQARSIIKKYDLTVDTVHSHIGCGNDPILWHQAAKLTLRLVSHFPSVTTLNLGGGFKVARMSDETATDLGPLGEGVSDLLSAYADHTGRKLHLEIEPGTLLTANAGALITRIQDMANTGRDGYSFLKLDTGMNDIMRPALHASQHPIIILNERAYNPHSYVVVGHNCESSDLLTPSPDDAESPEPRTLQEASIGNIAVIEGVGAYCSAMRLVGYNSFPTPNEVLVTSAGDFKLIRRRQELTDLTQSEIR